MTPEWKDAFKHAILLGDQLGMEMAIAGSPGWSESGGPWVPGPEGMKKYVWSETPVEGGKPFSGVLAHPPSNTGAFQNESIHDQQPPPGALKIPEFYADSVVVAYKRTAVDRPVEELAGEDHCERRLVRLGHARRRRPGKDHQDSDSRDGPGVVDSVRISCAADHSLHHVCDQGS